MVVSIESFYLSAIVESFRIDLFLLQVGLLIAILELVLLLVNGQLSDCLIEHLFHFILKDLLGFHFDVPKFQTRISIEIKLDFFKSDIRVR